MVSAPVSSRKGALDMKQTLLPTKTLLSHAVQGGYDDVHGANGDGCMPRRVIALNQSVLYIVCNAACDPQVAPKLRHELEQAAAAASKVRPATTGTQYCAARYCGVLIHMLVPPCLPCKSIQKSLKFHATITSRHSRAVDVS